MTGVNRNSLIHTIRHRDHKGIGISRKITQIESQKIDFILPLLDYMIINKKFYATELKQQFRNINHKSIERTILLLKERDLIVLHKTELKNKKIFKIKTVRGIKKYRNDLIKYKGFKILLSGVLPVRKIMALSSLGKINDFVIKGLQKSKKKSKFMTPLPEDFLTKLLYIKNKKTFLKLVATSKKWPERLSINEMKASIVIKIMADYRSGRICRECFKEKKLRYYTLKDEEFLCDFGHVSKINLDDSLQYSENEILDPKKISKRLTNAMFEFQKKNYLKKKKKN